MDFQTVFRRNFGALKQWIKRILGPVKCALLKEVQMTLSPHKLGFLKRNLGPLCHGFFQRIARGTKFSKI